MLDAFRSKGLQSAIYGVLIVATVIVFVVQFNPSAGKKSAKLTQSCAATVRGTCIEPKDHKAEFMLLVPIDEHGARQIGKAKSQHVPQLALEGLIERELLIDEAHRIGLTASEEEVSEAIFSGFLRVSIPADRPEMQTFLQAPDGKRYFGFWFRDPKTKEFDEKVYKRSLKNLVNESEIEFREFEEREILAAKMRDLVRAPVRISESEALESYLAEKSFAVLSYIEVKTAFVSRYGASPSSDADVEAWAKKPENAPLVEQTLETRKKDPPKDGNIRHILVNVGPADDAAKHAAALGKITEAYARIERGEPFGEVARAISEDSSKSKGGSMDTDKTDSFVTPFKAAANALKNGEMTHTAIESQFGYHLIMRDDSSRLAKDVARELYFKSRVDEATKEMAVRISAAMKSGKSADDAVAAEISALKPIPFLKITPDKSLDHKVVASDAGVSDASVASSSDASIGDGGAKFAVKSELDPAHDDDRPQALTSSSIKRGGDTLPKLGGADAAHLVEFSFNSKPGDVLEGALHMEGGGYYVTALKEHKLATKEEFDKDRVGYTDSLLRGRQNEALALYMKRLLDASRADVKRDESYMLEWTSDAGAASSEDDEP